MASTVLVEIRNDLNIAFGKRLRELRAKRELSQAELGLDRSYVSDIERGKKSPTLQVLKLLSKNLGVGMEQMVEGL